MSAHISTKHAIEEILNTNFSPLFLEVIDDSAAHQGHKHASLNSSAGHFIVTMKTTQFNGLAMVKRHRMVYEKLGSLMDTRIHALSLKLHGTDE